jgi:hypothetical protein
VRLLHDLGALIPEHQRQLVPVSWTLLADPHALRALRLYFVALNSGQPEMSDAERRRSVREQMNKGWMGHVRCHEARTLNAAATWERNNNQETAYLYSSRPAALATLRSLAAVDHGWCHSSESEKKGPKRHSTRPVRRSPLRGSGVLLQWERAAE